MKLIQSIWHDILEIKSTKKELREFGIVMGIFFALLTAFLIWKKKSFHIMLPLSGFFFLFALLNPFILKPFQKVWMALAVTIGWFVSRLILTVLFFLILTPLSLMAKLVGKKFLDISFKTDAASYWHSRPAALPSKERYEKQF